MRSAALSWAKRDRKLPWRSSSAASNAGTTIAIFASVPTLASLHTVTIRNCDSSVPGSARHHHQSVPMVTAIAAQISSAAASSQNIPLVGEIDCRSWVTSAHPNAFAGAIR